MKVLSEIPEMLQSMVEDKIRLQGRATEKYCDHLFDEMKRLEEKKSEEGGPATYTEEARFMEI